MPARIAIPLPVADGTTGLTYSKVGLIEASVTILRVQRQHFRTASMRTMTIDAMKVLRDALKYNLTKAAWNPFGIAFLFSWWRLQAQDSLRSKLKCEA